MNLKMNHTNNTEENHAQSSNDEDCFYFESDHLALRGNLDYSEVLKTMFVLEAQRSQALKDYDKLVELKEHYLNDPLSYVKKCEDGTLEIPTLQNIAELPKINWSKYSTSVPEHFMRQINSTRMPNAQQEQCFEKSHKSWSPEEQRKLEELLVKYPPEVIERKRIAKIANELGTRTKQQVASRLQKYYVKLMKAGLPVPGRLPKCARRYYERKSTKTHGNYHRKYNKPTTFFPDTIIPVVMDELECAPGPSTSSNHSDTNNVNPQEELVQSNYLLSNNYHIEQKTKIKCDNAIEIELLKCVKSEKLLERERPVYYHYGYQCDYCADDPIQGTRWHCTTCINTSIDFCTDCMITQFYSSDKHDTKHKFLIIRNEKEVTNGCWSESDSDSDGRSNNASDSNDDDDDPSGHSGQSSLEGSIHDDNGLDSKDEDVE